MSQPSPTTTSAVDRLAPVDGLRAAAVLGVIWWHTWIHSGNPAGTLRVGGRAVNWERWLAPLGTGFQLFFVLSGFCLYLSFQRLLRLPAAQSYRLFLERRWLRLTPAFYAVCAVTAAALWAAGQPPTIPTLIAHATWLLDWVPNTGALSPVFWTLQLEWEFYLLLPLLFFGRVHHLHRLRLLVLLLASLAYRAWIHTASNGIAGGGYFHLPAHFFGFAAGMIAAELWSRRGGLQSPPLAFGAAAAGIALVYFGRGLESTEVFQWAHSLGWVAKTLSDPVIALGYVLLLTGSLAPGAGCGRWLSLGFFQVTGRLSYGLYLWHWWPSVWICNWALRRFGLGAGTHYLGLALTLAVSYPLAWITYRLCEQPFLHGRRSKPKAALTPANGAPP